MIPKKRAMDLWIKSAPRNTLLKTQIGHTTCQLIGHLYLLLTQCIAFFYTIVYGKTYAQRHCEPPQEAWQSTLSAGGISGLLRCARNDGGCA
jgi:hypothetical protein